MVKDNAGITHQIGGRLRQLRKILNHSRPDMAAQLGINRTSYYKNETGESFPGTNTLYWLQKKFDISMDWLIFNRGPMYYKQKAPVEKKPRLEEQSPEVGQLLEAMEQDPRLKHEILAYFFKYRGKPKP
ncbi:MAG: helix-turn-helix transcriptional regulator [bacterium]|nr:helix-turn-helix transcriptional regulator [bacterium]